MYFFFQAEDGIRDDLVTGVQTCALPICSKKYSLTGRSSCSGGIFGERLISCPTVVSVESTRSNCSFGVLSGPHSIKSRTAAAGMRADNSLALRVGIGCMLARKCQPQPSRDV